MVAGSCADANHCQCAAVVGIVLRRHGYFSGILLVIDPLGRQLSYLRLSVIEACNFRCNYCLPDGFDYHGPHAPSLSRDEIRRLVSAFALLGTRKVRLTGGEPSLRRDLCAIIADIAAIAGISAVAMTSNGVLLDRRIAQWHEAGLRAINVSVDSLDAARFAAITGHDRLPAIVAGIDHALSLPGMVVKINAVLLRDLNDSQLPQWLEFVRSRPLSIRLIELMRTGDNEAFFARHHVRSVAIEALLRGAGWQLRTPAALAGPAREYQHPDYLGSIGIIAPYGADFCATCNRLRVTASGGLRTCLFADQGIDLRPLLRADTQADALRERIVAAVAAKVPAHALPMARYGDVRQLAQTGG